MERVKCGFSRRRCLRTVLVIVATWGRPDALVQLLGRPDRLLQRVALLVLDHLAHFSVLQAADLVHDFAAFLH